MRSADQWSTLEIDRWSKFCHGWTRIAFAMALERLRAEFDLMPWWIRKLFTAIQSIESWFSPTARLVLERLRAKRCGAIAGAPEGFLTMGPKIKCDRWQGHHGSHRAPYNDGSIEWPK